ncbi:MAG: hypothetical protein J6Z74_01800 [Eubacterium sp.]|nr:hypothetical protein [Eubacterium sp.]
MDKNIYDMLNDIKTDADEQLENGNFEELSEFETKKIMSKITGSKKSKKSNIKKYIPVAVGFAAAAALAVSLWVWKSTNKINDSSVEVTTETVTNEPNTEVTVAEADTGVEKTTEATTEKEHTTEEDTSLTIEKHQFTLTCASAKTAVFASEGDTTADYGFNVPIWKTYGTSGDLNFTRMLFTIEGEDISSVHVSIDKCALYLQEATNADTAHFMSGEGTPEELGLSEITNTETWTFYDPFGTIESVDTVKVVGNDYSCNYSPNQKFGFYIPPEKQLEVLSNETIEATGYYDWTYYDELVNLLRDAKLTIEVTFKDGSVVKEVYNVHPGNLEYYTLASNSDFRIPTTTFAADGADSEFGIVLEEVTQ